MITGKELIELGYRPSKWFKEAIEYANQHNLEGEALASYIKTIAPATIEPFGEPLPFHKNIKAETEAEITNVQQAFLNASEKSGRCALARSAQEWPNLSASAAGNAPQARAGDLVE